MTSFSTAKSNPFAPRSVIKCNICGQLFKTESQFQEHQALELQLAEQKKLAAETAEQEKEFEMLISKLLKKIAESNKVSEIKEAILTAYQDFNQNSYFKNICPETSSASSMLQSTKLLVEEVPCVTEYQQLVFKYKTEIKLVLPKKLSELVWFCNLEEINETLDCSITTSESSLTLTIVKELLEAQTLLYSSRQLLEDSHRNIMHQFLKAQSEQAHAVHSLTHVKNLKTSLDSEIQKLRNAQKQLENTIQTLQKTINSANTAFTECTKSTTKEIPLNNT